MGWPNGETDAQYGNWKNWSPSRSAWEFLRRNPEFRLRCEALTQLSEEEKKQERKRIAADFGLRKFVSAETEFGGKDRPRFRGGNVSYSGRLSEDEPDEYVKTLKVGEVIVRFDLNAALKNRGLVGAQIRRAKRQLLRSLDRYATSLDKPKPEKRKAPDVRSTLNALRYLDLSAAGKAKREIKKILEVSDKVMATAIATSKHMVSGGHYDFLGGKKKRAGKAP